MANDKVDAAIAATEQAPAVEMEQLQVTISSSGKPFIVAYPVDMTDGELLEVFGWMATQLRGRIAQRRDAANPASRLVIARGALPGRN